MTHPTETQIVDALHDAAAEYGDYAEAECIANAMRDLTPPDADDAQREEISALVRRTWQRRFDVAGVF